MSFVGADTYTFVCSPAGCTWEAKPSLFTGVVPWNPDNNCVLRTGYWDDNGTFRDDCIWNDFGWLLASGVWDDTGIWDDTAYWSE